MVAGVDECFDLGALITIFASLMLEKCVEAGTKSRVVVGRQKKKKTTPTEISRYQVTNTIAGASLFARRIPDNEL